jgi:OOP family OmpA-OmpF porin
MALSARRAEAIRAALLAAGLPAGQMVAKGYGPAQPITENETKEGRAKNRRIALTWGAPEAGQN